MDTHVIRPMTVSHIRSGTLGKTPKLSRIAKSNLEIDKVSKRMLVKMNMAGDEPSETYHADANMKPGAIFRATDRGKTPSNHRTSTEKLPAEHVPSSSVIQAYDTRGANRSRRIGATRAQTETARASRVTKAHISFFAESRASSSFITTVTSLGGPVPFVLVCRKSPDIYLMIPRELLISSVLVIFHNKSTDVNCL